MAGLEGAFLCLGNPLLDVAAVVDQTFLDKYEVSVFLHVNLVLISDANIYGTSFACGAARADQACEPDSC